MKFDTASGRGWETANQACKEAFRLNADVNAFAFSGLAHAVWEISLGLARAYPHRKTVAYAMDEGPLFETLCGRMSSDGCIVKALAPADLQSPDKWLEGCKKDLLMTLSSIDDPISAEWLSVSALETALADSRALQLRVSHFRHRFEKPVALAPYEIRLCSIDTGLAVALCGARVKIDAPIAERLDWSVLRTADDAAKRIDFAKPSEIEASVRAIAEFMAQLPEGAQAPPPHLLAQGPAIARALFYYKDLDASSLIEAAIDGGFDTLIDDSASANGCRALGAHPLENFVRSRGLSPQAARGMIAIGARSASDPFAKNYFEEARAKILKMQAY